MSSRVSRDNIKRVLVICRTTSFLSESAGYVFLTVMLVIAALQFPIYGVIVLRSRSVRRAVVILVAAHFLCVALVFALAYLFSGRSL